MLPDASGKHAAAMLADPPSTLLLFGIEPQYDFAEASRATSALAGSKVIAFSSFASEHLKSVADMILPIGLLPEIEATFTTLDGFAQTSVAGGKLPGQARSGWRVLRALIESMALPGFDFTDIAGLRARASQGAIASGTGLAPAVPAGQGFERIVTSPIYRGDAVLRRATALNLHPLTLGPHAVMNPEDAKARGLANGAICKVGDGQGSAALPVSISARVAPGAIWIERGYEATAPMSSTATLEVAGA